MNLDLTKLKRGDTVVFANGHKHTLDKSDCIEQYQYAKDKTDRAWDIVRVIKAKKPKRDRDADWLMKQAMSVTFSHEEQKRLRVIAGRLRKGNV